MSLSETFLVSPLSVPGCQLWLDATDVNGNGTTPANGSVIATWVDKSGNGRNFTQGTSGNRPVYGSFLSYPGISFTGASNTNLSNSYIQTGSGGRNTFIVFYDVNTSANQYGNPVLFYMANTNQSALGDWRAAYDGANNYLGTDALAGAYIYRTNPAVTNMRTSRCIAMWGIRSGAGFNTGYVYGNGTQFTTLVNSFAATNPLNVTNTGTTSIGGGQTGYATAVISEVIYYSTDISIAERQKIEGYLAWKWGLTSSLPSIHPYKTSRPLNGIPLPTSLLVPTRPLRNVFVFNPTVLSNCALWLDAADRSSMILSGSNVIQWNDKSGNGRNTSAVYGTPFIRTDGFGGRQSIYFSSGAGLTGPITNTGTEVTTFVVARFNSTGGRVLVLGQGNRSDFGTSTDIVALTTGNTAAELGWYRNVASVGVGSAFVTTIYNSGFLYNLTVNGSTGIIWLNSTSTASGTTSGNFGYSTYGLGVQFFNSGGGVFPSLGDGFIAEVLVYNSAFTTPQRQQIEGYLAWKWGLESNLPVSHPFRTNPPDLPAAAPRGIPQLKSAFFNPRTITGIQLWLDAADSSTLTLSGTSVVQWRDKINSTVMTTQGTVGNATLLKGINGNQSIYFNNSVSDSVYMSGSFASLPIGTAFYVVQSFNQRNVSWRPFATWWNTGQFPAYGYLGLTTVNTVGPYTTFASPNGTPTQVLTAGSNYLISYGWSGTTTYVTTNGSSLQTGSQQAYTSNTTTFWIGADGTGATERITLYYGEMLFYNSVLSTVQRQKVEGYLAWKWKLQGNLPSTHPFKLFPPSP